MRDLFKGFYTLSDDDKKTLQANAIFIFDTSVLCNLYRYESENRETLLKVIESLSNRVWIPHHVALEYQRNRLNIIAEQKRHFSAIKKRVSNFVSGMNKEFTDLQLEQRHSDINPEELLSELTSMENKFVKKLGEFEKNSMDVNSYDVIREKIEHLFDGRIGNPPQDQNEVDSISKEGELRYKYKIPPGFEDSVKDKNKPDEFAYGGLVYKRKFGDLIIWKQIIQHVKSEEIKNVIFVTDDAKEDWWWKIDSNGQRIIGVRPELVDEICREGKTEMFHMYSVKEFLKYVGKPNNSLTSDKLENAIQDASEVALRTQESSYQDIRARYVKAENAVYVWLSSLFDELEKNQRGFPDYIAYRGGQKFGFEVKVIKNVTDTVGASRSVRFLREAIYRAYYALNEDDFHEMTMVIVLFGSDAEAAPNVIHQLLRHYSDLNKGLKIVVGEVMHNEPASGYSFIPLGRLTL